MNSLKQFLKKIIHIVKVELKDPYTFVVFLVVLIVMYSPAWGGYLLYFFIKQAWLLALASAMLLSGQDPSLHFSHCVWH